MSTIFIRTILLYLVVNVALRMMGKRQIGELQPSELVVTILISELAAIPMQDNAIPLIYGIIPILTLCALEVLLSYLMLKNCKAREILMGRPSMIIEEGIIDKSELLRLRFNMDDLITELRLLGYTNLKDIRFAIIETNGKLSVVPVAGKQVVKSESLSFKISEENIHFVLISAGKLRPEHIARIGKSEKWVEAQLRKQHIASVRDVLFMSADKDGNCVIQKDAGAKK